MITFDKAVRNLFKIIDDIIRSAELDDSNSAVKRYRKYVRTYEKTRADEHIVDFHNLFERFRVEFLTGPHKKGNDDWLRSNSVTLQYDPVEKCKIMLNVFYKKATEMREDLEMNLSKLPKEIYEKEASKAKALIYPDVFILHLYEVILAVLYDGEDKKELDVHYREVGKSVGYKFGETAATNTAAGGSVPDIAGMVTNMIKSVPLPAGVPGTENISGVVSGILEQPVFKNLLSSISNPDPSRTPQDFLAETFKTLMDPSVMSSIQKSVEDSQPKID